MHHESHLGTADRSCSHSGTDGRSLGNGEDHIIHQSKAAAHAATLLSDGHLRSARPVCRLFLARLRLDGSTLSPLFQSFHPSL